MEKIEVKAKRSLQSSKNFATAQQMDQVATFIGKNRTKILKIKFKKNSNTKNQGDESVRRAARSPEECFIHDERGEAGDEPNTQSGSTSQTKVR